MKFQKKDFIFLALIVVCTAVVFFTAGAFFADYLESTRLETTVIEYVPATAPSSDATTSSSATVDKTTITTSSVTTTTITTTTTMKTTQNTTTSLVGKVNINTATKEELMSIKGIGEVYATRIIEYRNEIGYYASLEELLEVKGIGEKRLAQWEPFLTV